MRHLQAASLFIMTATSLEAQTIHSGNGSIIGSLCVGLFCTPTESFTNVPLRVQGDRINMEFIDVSSSSFPNRDWAFKINDNGSFGTGGEEHFTIRDLTADTDPFKIMGGAPDNAVFINAAGNVGLGTALPAAPLELASNTNFNFFRLTATGAAVNDSVDITFTGGPLGTGQLRYNIVDGDNQEMSLDANGNMVLDGTLTTAGPTCAGGCDRVFDADYSLPSVAEHAKLMYQDGHLPGIGPTIPNAPVNVTEKLGQVINELEHAHIYIAMQNEALQAERARNDRLERHVSELLTRVAALEGL